MTTDLKSIAKSRSVDELVGWCRWLPLDTAERKTCEAGAVELAGRLKVLQNRFNGIDVALRVSEDEVLRLRNSLEEAQQKIVAQYDKMVEQQIHIFELMNKLADAGHPYATALPELAAHDAELTAKAKAEALEEFMLQFGDEDCPPRLVDDALAKAAEYRAKAGRKE